MPDRDATVQARQERSLLATRKEYREALKRLIGLAQRELRMFDADFSGLDIDSPQTYALLRAFLLRERNNRLYIAVHETAFIRSYCPRLLDLLRQYSDRMYIHQTQGEAANAQDCLVLADKLHFVRRPVQAQPRAVFTLNDEEQCRGMHLRFSEIWDSSFPAVSATTSGL